MCVEKNAQNSYYVKKHRRKRNEVYEKVKRETGIDTTSIEYFL